MNEIILFEKKQVRRVQIRNEWWFVIKDVVAVLTESKNPSDYLKKLRKRDNSLNQSFKGGGQLVPPLKLPFDTSGGKQVLQCWNSMGVLRLIQSIPSPKAEPFKRHLEKLKKENRLKRVDPDKGSYWIVTDKK